MTASITVSTPRGGLFKAFISAMYFLSREATAPLAALREGIAFSSSRSAAAAASLAMRVSSSIFFCSCWMNLSRSSATSLSLLASYKRA